MDKKPTAPHHKPFPVEVNGPAMIIMHLDAVKRGAVLDMGLIRDRAARTIEYIQRIGKGDLPMWHELIPCPGCGSTTPGRDTNGLCNSCNAKNKVAGDQE